MLLAARMASASSPAIGTVHNGTVSEQFFPTVPPNAFSPADVLDLYLHRGSFETVLADEDQEQDPDRWVSHTPCGQEFWQILSQWVWNLRLEFGQHVSASPMRVTELAYSQIDESVQASEPVQGGEPVKASEPVCYGPAQWARRYAHQRICRNRFRSATRWNAAVSRRSPTLPARAASGARWLGASPLCRPDRPLSLLSSARTVPGKHHHQQTAARERAVLATDFHHFTARSTAARAASAFSPGADGGDWERCQLRRRWFSLLRTQTVLLTFGPVQHMAGEDVPLPDGLTTRAQRAHWRLSWQQRLARNARPPTAPSLEVTIHGLPVSFAHVFGFDVVMAAYLLVNTARFFFLGSLLFSVPSLATK